MPPPALDAPRPWILAIETSCDETSVAAVDGRGSILAQETASQIAAHRPYGGVVPELASRNHTALLPRVLEAVLGGLGLRPSDFDAFAATAGPGLASSLLVGNTTAKAMALANDRPYFAVNHLEGHVLSPFCGRPAIPPSVVLVVSGGHTLLLRVSGTGKYELLGRTRDDAAGEAFDKVGKLLGLPYPGGPEVDRWAAQGNPRAYDFPRGMIESGDFDFSFSGLKTSVRYRLEGLDADRRESWLADVCASFQEAVVEVLVAKTMAAARACGATTVAVGGGVACNRRLRSALTDACSSAGLELLMVSPALATDNAAMIAEAARHRLGREPGNALDEDIDPNLPLPGLGRLRGELAQDAPASGAGPAASA